MSSMRDRLNQMRATRGNRLDIQSPKAGEHPKPLPTKPQPQAKQQRQKPQAIGWEKLKCACGHIIDFEIYPEKQDKFREERRKKVLDRECGECRQKRHKELTEKQKAEAKERRKTKPKKWPKWKVEASAQLARLPDKAEYLTIYDSEKQLWRGELSIPLGETRKVFDGTHSALFKLLSDLDTQYRLWKQELEKEKK